MTDFPETSRWDDELPLDQMAVMQEPPIDLDDTPPTGVFRTSDAPKTNPRNTDPIKTPRAGIPWLNWLLSGAAMLITAAAGILYLQQSNQPAAPTPQPTAPITIIEATVLPTDSPTLSPTQPTAQSQSPDTADGGVPVDVVAELLVQP